MSIGEQASVPRRSSPRGWLDAAATMAVILGGASMVVMAIADLRRPSQRTTQMRDVYQVGERFDTLAGYDFSSADSTLILWVQSRCKYCTESMTFYQRIATAPRRAAIVVMGREPTDVLMAYVEGHGVRPDKVVSVKSQPIRLFGTPILVLVSKDGTIRSIWRGKLGSDEQDRVLKALE